MKTPLVSINILSHNRENCLRQTLNKVFEQDYKNIEVIVVDNNSNDALVEMIEKEFSNVKVIKLKENIGASALNYGFKKSKGEFILILDDDSYPGKGTIHAGLNLILRNGNIAVIGFAIQNTYYHKIENDDYYNNQQKIEREAISFIGCGAMIRKKHFLKLGGFEPEIFLYHNELDFSIRASNAGYKILFDPVHFVYHTYSLDQRKQKDNKNIFIGERRYVNTFKSYFIYLYKNFNVHYFLKYTIKLVISKLYVAIRLGFLKSFFKTLFYLFYILISKNVKRYPVNKSVQKKYNYGNLKFNDLYVY